MLKLLAGIIFLMLTVRVTFAQSDPAPGILSIPQLKQDVIALRKALEKHHPGIYWYTSKVEFDETWESLNQSLDRSLTELEFFRLLLPVVAKVKCAHTLFYPSASILSSGKRFPIDIKLIGDKIYLMPDSGSSNIPKGSELISINERSARTILHELVPSLQAQGGNPGWKKVILENDFQNYYYYTIEQSNQFLVKYVNYKTGQEESTTIDGSGNDLLRKHWKNWYPSTDGPPLNIHYTEDSHSAILTIKSLVRGRIKSYNQDFEKLMDQYLGEIKKRGIEKLIIDVRGNEGGNNPEMLYSYIALRNDARLNDNTIAITPAKNSFEGEVIALANERSISAQETFVSIFRHYKRGSIVGRNTPGCVKGLCGGKKHKLTLPNSRFEILIPTHISKGIHDEPQDLKPGEGFPPDFYIEDNIHDTVQDKDAAMLFAVDLIQKIK